MQSEKPENPGNPGKRRRMSDDERFMKEALRQAEKARALGEVPIGCVIVMDGRIIARGYNRRTVSANVLNHAEIIAIRKACRVRGDWRLEECELYVTLEPCPMCAGAIVQARIPKVHIGCRNPKAGCAGSVIDLFHQEKLNHQVETEDGPLSAECSELMRSFFRNLRKAHPVKVKYSRNTGREAAGSMPSPSVSCAPLPPVQS